MIVEASETDQRARDLANKIARLIVGQNEATTLEKLQRSVEDICARLDALESAPPEIKETAVAHASQDRFEIAEAGVDHSPNGLSAEKACPYEPTAKPCDHCSMCSSRGF
jgi:hypothetical protein